MSETDTTKTSEVPTLEVPPGQYPTLQQLADYPAEIGKWYEKAIRRLEGETKAKTLLQSQVDMLMHNHAEKDRLLQIGQAAVIHLTSLGKENYIFVKDDESEDLEKQEAFYNQTQEILKAWNFLKS
jgi:hypothetical protein